jgi:curved DNA-binding protein CbpA
VLSSTIKNTIGSKAGLIDGIAVSSAKTGLAQAETLRKAGPDPIFVPELLGNHYKKASTGILTLKSGSVIKTIHFDTGHIVFASSNLQSDHLGEKLVKSGLLSEEALRMALELMSRFHLKLGQILVEMKYVREEDLKEHVTCQVSEIVFSTFLWQSPEAEFEYGPLPNYEFKLSMSTAQILLEGIRRLDNLTMLQQIIGDLKSPLRLVADPRLRYQIISLKPEEAFLVSRLEKAPYTTQELIDMGSVPELVVLKTIGALLRAGIITSELGQEVNTLPAIMTEIIEQERNLSFDTRAIREFCYEVDSKMQSVTSKASHYEVLEIGYNATFEEISRVYTHLAMRFHPDRQAQLFDYRLNLRAELESIFNRLTQAYQVLSDPRKRKHYDSKLGQLLRCSTAVSTISEAEKINRIHKAAMEFCYQIETKLREIKCGATYYLILEVERSATLEQIKAAYFLLREKFNIKRAEELSVYGVDVSAQQRDILTALNKAFEILSNPDQKQSYDYQVGKQLRCNSVSFQNPPKLSPPLTASSGSNLPNQSTATPVLQPLRASSIQAVSYQHTESIESVNNQYSKNGQSGQAIMEKSKARKANEYYTRALGLYYEQRYEQAVIALCRALEISPKEAEYWAQLGRVYSLLQNTKRQVEAAYREAMNLEPDEVDYPLELGLVYQKYGLHKKAVEMFQRALSIDPKNVMAKRALANTSQTENVSKKSDLKWFLSKLGFVR